jgi:hypothetical protein
MVAPGRNYGFSESSRCDHSPYRHFRWRTRHESYANPIDEAPQPSGASRESRGFCVGSIPKPTLCGDSQATVLLNSDANGGRVAPNVGRAVAPEASDDSHQASQ